MKMLLKTSFAAIASYLCMLLLFASCSFETEVGGGNHYTGRKIALNIQMETQSASTPDLEIVRVRAIVFSGEGKLVHNEVSTPSTAPDGSCSVKVKAARGINHVYLICNETSELTGKLDAIRVRGDIEDVTFSAVGITGAPPMYGKVEDANVQARSDGSQATVTVGGVTSAELSVKMTRMVARIGFTAIKNVDTTTSEDFKVTKLSVRICHMPTQTTIGEGRKYTADQWSDDLLIEQEGLLDNNGTYQIDASTTPPAYTVPADITPIVLPDTYIPENLLATPSDASRATYLKIEAQCQMKNGSTQVLHGVYLLDIGQGSTLNYSLPRNNYFHIYATITGMGALGIYAEIVAMEEHDITINWKPIDGLVIVSDKSDDFDATAGTSKNVNIWDDYNVYSGILKTYHADNGYNDIVFKYGSLIAVKNNATAGTPFVPPAGTDMNDILWYPSSFDVTTITDWAGVPYLASGDIPADNSVEQVRQALGDPCKLVGLSEVQIRDNGIVDNNLWHMATPEEYNVLINAQDYVDRTYGYGAFHWLLLPYVNYRDASGTTAGTASAGQFWTTAALSAFATSGTTASLADSQDGQRGYTVRCVRNTIPESKITVDRVISVDYKGNSTGAGAPFSIGSNVPYWKAELVTTSSDIGFDDFSFQSGDTQVHTAYGSFTQEIPVYIKRWESTSTRNFKVRVEGTGLDGKTVFKEFTISQSGFRYAVDMTFSPLLVNNTVPKAGATYDITLTINPQDVPMVAASKLKIQAVYMNTQIGMSNEIDISPGQYIYSGLSITIPENTTPDIISLDLNINMYQVDKWIQLGKRSLLQSN